MYAWLIGKKIILYPMIRMWGEQLLFGLYYTFLYYYNQYCNNVRKIQTMWNTITGTEVHQYIVPKYNNREEISPQ